MKKWSGAELFVRFPRLILLGGPVTDLQGYVIYPKGTDSRVRGKFLKMPPT